MKDIVTTIGAILIAFSLGCAQAVSTYPSYERTVAKYAPKDGREGTRAEQGVCDDDEAICDCPRVWHHDRWIYICDDRYLYRHHGYWYYYPNPHFYYFDGPGRGHPHRARRITKE